MTTRLDSAPRVALAALLLLAAGCGGSGGGSPPPLTLSIASDGSVDGFVTSDGFAFTVNPVFGITAGDNPGDDTGRGILRFPLATVPAGATLVSAVVTIHQFVVVGTPYTDLGTVTVDHLDIGAALDPGDYGSVALTAAFTTLSTDATLGTKSMVVTLQVAADLASGRPNSDFRLRFTTDTDSDATDDHTRFNDGEDAFASGLVPTLTITYQP